MSVQSELLEIIGDFVELPEGGFDFDEPLKFADGLNSFVFLSMITEIEDRFGITIPNENIIEIKTLNDIVRIIEK